MRILLTAAQIQERVRTLALEIHRDHPYGVHLVCVLKGAFIFLADVVRAMPGDSSLDFMAVSSYGSSTSTSGEVKLVKDLDSSLEGRDVVIIEDIVDTGLTLTYLQEILGARSPRNLRTACLLSKPSRRKVERPRGLHRLHDRGRIRRRIRSGFRRTVSQPAVYRHPRADGHRRLASSPVLRRSRRNGESGRRSPRP